MKFTFFNVKLVCAGLFLTAFTTMNHAQTVSTLAGSGSSGSNDGVGTSASFNNPTGVFITSTGELYVSDGSNYKIRKVTLSGTTTTVAGTGSFGHTDGPAASAQFKYPHGICEDPSGNVYIADMISYSIRKISPSGAVSTFAGTGTSGFVNSNAPNAQFNRPQGICMDDSGNLFVTDRFNHCIRKISTSGQVTTFAGSGVGGFADGTGPNAQFHFPSSICIDAANNLYVGDEVNNRIRKITPAGVVTTLAGTGAIGSNNGQGSTATFSSPRGVCIDADGNVFVTDAGNNLIRKINTNGYVFTYAGTGNAGSNNGPANVASFNNPVGISIDNANNLYIGDRDNHQIRKISPPCSQTDAYISQLECDSYTSPSGNYIWTQSGTYTDTIPNAGGCDSVMHITLTISSVSDLTTTINGIDITANNSAATYQWIDCSTNTNITAETSQTFTPSSNGSYAVELTENGCVDTSDCVVITTVKLEELNDQKVSVYPNPVKGSLNVHITNQAEIQSLKVISVNGQLMYSDKNLNASAIQINTESWESGVYILTLTFKDEIHTLKFNK